MQARWLLGFVLAVYLGLAALWLTVVPLGEGPDEPAHFDYALFLAREQRLPRQTATQVDVPGEGHQPPLAYWLMQPAVRWLDEPAQQLQVWNNPAFVWAGGDQPNGYYHGARERWPWQAQVLAWRGARAISVLLGALTACLIWLTARRIWPDQPTVALGAVALAAWNPQFVFQHALVSNDPLLFTLSSGLLYGCVWIVTAPVVSGPDRSWLGLSVALGALLGALLVTKQSALALVPLPFIALWLGRDSLRRKLRASAVVATVTVLAAAWWYVRNWQLYGDPLGLNVFRETFARSDFDPGQWSAWRAGLWSLLRSSWGVFGWQTLALADGAYRIFGGMLALAVVGIVASVGAGWWQARWRIALLLAAMIGLIFVWTVAFAQTAGMVAWQGRFLFPAIGALSIGLACGLGALLPRRSGLITVAVGLALLTLGVPLRLLGPTYPIYAQTAQEATVGELYAAFGPGWRPGIDLRNAEFAPRHTQGTPWPITLTWQVAEPLDRNWWIFVHLVDRTDTVVAKNDAQPLDGRYALSAGVPGDWITDRKRLDLRDVRPGRYEIRVGMFDPATTERVGVYDRAGVLLGDYMVVGQLEVTP